MDRQTRSSAMAAGALACMAALAAGVHALPPSMPGRFIGLALLLAAAPAAAAVAAGLLMHRLPSEQRPPWLLLAGASAAAVLAQLHPPDHSLDAVTAAQLHGAAMFLVAVGTGWLLHQVHPARPSDRFTDTALLVAVAATATLHWSPETGDLAVDLPRAAAALVAPMAAGTALCFALVVAIAGHGGASAPRAWAMVVAAIFAGVAVAPLALGRQLCCTAGTWSGTAWTFSWLGLAYACVRTAGMREGGERDGPEEKSRPWLLVTPVATTVLAAILLDAAWRDGVSQVTVTALSVVAVLLAVRVSQLLLATRYHRAQRVKLGQSRALIEVSHALSSTRDLDETLRLVSYWTTRLLRGRGACIELVSEDGEWLEPRAVTGLPDDALRLRFGVDDGFTGWVVRHGRSRTTADAGSDSSVHPWMRPHLRDSSLASVPLQYGERTFGALTCMGAAPFTAEDMELLGAFAEQAAVAIENARLFRQVHYLSVTDPLTGLANRRQMERDLSREFAAARRGRSLVAVMFDLNGFKQFNDTWGHLQGDEALRRFGSTLRAETRAMNMAARFGGDEFVVLLTDADEESAQVFVARIRARFPGPDAGEPFSSISVAAGIARFDARMGGPEELLAAADRALYQDKAASAARPRVRT